MTFFERFELLCKNRGLKPQSKEVLQVIGVSSPSVTGWAKGALPKAETLIKLASFFEVTVDYLLCIDDNLNTIKDIDDISESAHEIAKRYDALDADGQALVRAELIKAEDRMKEAATTQSKSKRYVG